MSRNGKYPDELREREVRMVLDHQDEYGSQWEAIGADPFTSSGEQEYRLEGQQGGRAMGSHGDRRRRAALVGAALVAGIVGGWVTKPAAAQVDPPSAMATASAEETTLWRAFAPFVIDQGRMMSLHLNNDWNVVRTGKPATHVGQAQTSYPSSDPAFGVWSGRCTKGKQTITLRRHVNLPGAPSDMSIDLNAAHPYDIRAVVLFNGKVVSRADSVDLVELTSADARKLQSGRNTIEVRLTKVAHPYSCDTWRGVSMELLGWFTTDLYVGKPVKNPAYIGPSAAMKTRVRNLGKSPVRSATLFIEMGGGFPQDGGGWEFELRAGSGCTATEPGPTFGNWRITCPLSNLEPGSDIYFLNEVRYDAESTAFTQTTRSITMRVVQNGPVGTGPNDIDMSNNLSIQGVVFCGTLATDPGCLNA